MNIQVLFLNYGLKIKVPKNQYKNGVTNTMALSMIPHLARILDDLCNDTALKTRPNKLVKGAISKGIPCSF